MNRGGARLRSPAFGLGITASRLILARFRPPRKQTILICHCVTAGRHSRRRAVGQREHYDCLLRDCRLRGGPCASVYA